MENIKHCALCLGQILDYKFDTVENLSLDKLGFTLNKDAVICCKCSKICQIVNNFKTTSANNYEHLKTFVHPGSDTKLVLEGIIIRQVKREVKCEEERVCLLCLKYYEVDLLMDVNLGQDIVMKDMLEKCLPEIDTTIVQSPSICYNCKGILAEHCNFILRYKDTEVLRNLKKETDSFIKPETLNAKSKNIYSYADDGLVKIEENRKEIEEAAFEIKTENILIDESCKVSLDETEEVSKLSGDITNKKFACDLCSYRPKRHYALKTHYYQVHKVLKELEGFKCEQCPYITKRMSYLVDHRLSHGLETSQFRCAQCSFVSQRKSSLNQHSRLHKDPLETKRRFKCSKCLYQTSKQCDLLCHMERHEELRETDEEVTILTCNSCSFTTIRRSSFMRHYNKLHKAVEGEFREKNIVMIKLSSGRLKTKIMAVSGDPLSKTFDCDKCTYRGRKQQYLNEHYLVHLDIPEVRKFKCNKCSYVTKRRSSLYTHRLVHVDPLERKTHSCTKCSFETKSRSTLGSHFERHHIDLDEGPRTYTCYECNYTTTYRSCIVNHLKNHRQGKSMRKLKKRETSQKIH